MQHLSQNIFNLLWNLDLLSFIGVCECVWVKHLVIENVANIVGNESYLILTLWNEIQHTLKTQQEDSWNIFNLICYSCQDSNTRIFLLFPFIFISTFYSFFIEFSKKVFFCLSDGIFKGRSFCAKKVMRNEQTKKGGFHHDIE